MGEVEEEKKTEEIKTDEEKTENMKSEEETKTEGKPDEPTNGDVPPPPPPPPPPPKNIVLKVFMHCERCARKVCQLLKDFPGVDDVITDCKSHIVVVKGEKADPLKVIERLQKKSHRKVELLYPISNPLEEEKIEEEEKPTPEEEREETQILIVDLKVYMHCEDCAQRIKKRILKMNGVEWVETDLENSMVSVKGVYDPAMLVEYVYKRLGKHAVILNEEKAEKEEKLEEEEKPEEEKKEEKIEEVEEEKKGEENSEAEPQEKDVTVVIKEETKAEKEEDETIMKNEYYYYNPPMDWYEYPTVAYPYPPYPPPAPQLFSDENPNACSVM